jgi:hypothetical protein
MIQFINLKIECETYLNRSENADADVVINNICIRIHILRLSLLWVK